jgi:hypothetical protein
MPINDKYDLLEAFETRDPQDVFRDLQREYRGHDPVDLLNRFRLNINNTREFRAAVFLAAGEDYLAYGVMKNLEQAGYSIPEVTTAFHEEYTHGNRTIYTAGGSVSPQDQINYSLLWFPSAASGLSGKALDEFPISCSEITTKHLQEGTLYTLNRLGCDISMQADKDGMHFTVSNPATGQSATNNTVLPYDIKPEHVGYYTGFSNMVTLAKATSVDTQQFAALSKAATGNEIDPQMFEKNPLLAFGVAKTAHTKGVFDGVQAATPAAPSSKVPAGSAMNIVASPQKGAAIEEITPLAAAGMKDAAVLASVNQSALFQMESSTGYRLAVALTDEGKYRAYLRSDKGSYSKTVSDFSGLQEMIFQEAASNQRGLPGTATDTTCGFSDDQFSQMQSSMGRLSVVARKEAISINANQTPVLNIASETGYRLTISVTDEGEYRAFLRSNKGNHVKTVADFDGLKEMIFQEAARSQRGLPGTATDTSCGFSDDQLGQIQNAMERFSTIALKESISMTANKEPIGLFTSKDGFNVALTSRGGQVFMHLSHPDYISQHQPVASLKEISSVLHRTAEDLDRRHEGSVSNGFCGFSVDDLKAMDQAITAKGVSQYTPPMRGGGSGMALGA